MAKSKTISIKATERNQIKHVKIAEQERERYPTWRFSTADKFGPFAWPVGKQEELEVVKRLHEFDSMEWMSIKGGVHHSIKVKDLGKEAQKRLLEIEQDDVSAVFSFHLTGTLRIFAILDRHIAKLLWYDPKHKVYPSKKKNT
ncbi:MAG: hypothetical protein KJ630_07040 [Proteobacteria bacterium]|nr:hypothetical protein [Pseudomonadota bacterium]